MMPHYNPVFLPGNLVKLLAHEELIFQLLKDFVSEHKLPVVLRVAGGWVRDKLLGLDSHDLDIAIDTMKGEPFARRLHQYLSAHAVASSSLGIIQSNPDRSKHLETATLRILGHSVDFVNLRAEHYAKDSRIPSEISFGTPLEDALRRDCTINALFYNLNEDTVEDWTGRGWNDLQNGIIQTPLQPVETLLDDPLRLLRIIRFSNRFQYQITSDVRAACTNELVREAFQGKVSRERVGVEFTKILESKYPLEGLELLAKLRALELVYVDSEELTESFLADFQETSLGLLEQSQIRLACLTVPLIPFYGKIVKSAKREEPFYVSILRDQIKLSNRDINDCTLIMGNLDALTKFAFDLESATPCKVGPVIKDLGSIWPICLALSAFYAKRQQPSLPTDQIIAAFKSLTLHIHNLGVAECWKWKPALSGTTVAGILGIKPGPLLGEVLKKLAEWQYCNPNGSEEQAIEFINRSR